MAIDYGPGHNPHAPAVLTTSGNLTEAYAHTTVKPGPISNESGLRPGVVIERPPALDTLSSSQQYAIESTDPRLWYAIS